MFVKFTSHYCSVELLTDIDEGFICISILGLFILLLPPQQGWSLVWPLQRTVFLYHWRHGSRCPVSWNLEPRIKIWIVLYTRVSVRFDAQLFCTLRYSIINFSNSYISSTMQRMVIDLVYNNSPLIKDCSVSLWSMILSGGDTYWVIG